MRTILTLLCTFPAAYALARLRFPGRRAYLRVILITQMLSPIVIIIPLFHWPSSSRAIDTYWSLIVFNAAFALSFAIWLMTTYFQSIPVEIEEASVGGRVLTAGRAEPDYAAARLARG